MTTATTINHTQTPETSKALEYFEAKNQFTTGPVEVWHMIEDGREDVRIVDVRAAEDYEKAHVPGAVSLPRDRWQDPQGLAKDKTNVLYCYTQTCHLAVKAAIELAGQGYPVMEMEGGFKAWQESGLDTEPKAAPRRAPKRDSIEDAGHMQL